MSPCRYNPALTPFFSQLSPTKNPLCLYDLLMRPAPPNQSPFNNQKIHRIPAQLRAISFENWGTKPSPLLSQPTFCLAAQLPSAPARVHCCSLTSFPSAAGEALHAWTSQTLPSAFPIPAFPSPFDASCSLQDLSQSHVMDLAPRLPRTQTCSLPALWRPQQRPC